MRIEIRSYPSVLLKSKDRIILVISSMQISKDEIFDVVSKLHYEEECSRY